METSKQRARLALYKWHVPLVWGKSDVLSQWLGEVEFGFGMRWDKSEAVLLLGRLYVLLTLRTQTL